MDKRLVAGVLALLGLSATFAACSGGSASTAGPGGGTAAATVGQQASPAAGGGSGASAAAGGADGFEGTLTSSGLYSANWTVTPGTAANPMNATNNPTMTSDKGSFGLPKVRSTSVTSARSAATSPVGRLA